MNPVRVLVDSLKNKRKEAAVREEAERLAAQEAVQIELSTLERFARLVEAVQEAKRAYQVVVNRMDQECQPYTLQDAGRDLCSDFAHLPRVINSLTASQCLLKHRAALLKEIEIQLVGGAEAELRQFQESNFALLQRHNVVS
jgi:hypothetical protein